MIQRASERGEHGRGAGRSELPSSFGHLLAEDHGEIRVVLELPPGLRRAVGTVAVFGIPQRQLVVESVEVFEEDDPANLASFPEDAERVVFDP